MTKQEFLDGLRKGLVGLSQADIDERAAFYGEMIDDRIEDGLTETEAVAQMGGVDSVVAQILAETPLTRLVKERIKPKRKLGILEMVLIILGAPIWGSLLISIIAIVLSIYVSIWSVIVALWSVFVAFVGSVLGGIVASVIFLVTGRVTTGFATLAAAIVLAGISIFAFFGCKYATKGILWLTQKMKNGVKKSFVGKGEA